MHRDLKLGLALAVLLIGSTTAFFFRNDRDPDAGLPTLRDPDRVDGEIAHRDILPYLGRPENETTIAADSPWAKPAFLGGSSAVVRRASLTPDPIQIIMEEDPELLSPAPRPLPPSPSVEPETDETGQRIHIVKPGDTLTALASRYLGSLARYGEIYELNRDQLKGPHDLRVGMRLRIPPTAPQTTPQELALVEPAQISESDESEQPESEAAKPDSAGPDSTNLLRDETPPSDEVAPAAEERRFVPARQMPFIPHRYRPSQAQ